MASPISEEQRAKLLRSETRSLLQSPDFIRSPVMSQLLSYLVEEAITNPGNPPKAYQVAVDGLGRSRISMSRLTAIRAFRSADCAKCSPPIMPLMAASTGCISR